MRNQTRSLKVRLFNWKVRNLVSFRLKLYHHLLIILEYNEIFELPLLTKAFEILFYTQGFKPKDYVHLAVVYEYEELLECDGLCTNGESFAYNENILIVYKYVSRAYELAKLRYKMSYKWWFWIPAFGMVFSPVKVHMYYYEELKRENLIVAFVLYHFFTISIIAMMSPYYLI